MTFADKVVMSLHDLAFKGFYSENRDEIFADGAFQIAKKIYKHVKIKGPRYEVIEDIAADIEEYLIECNLKRVVLLNDYYHLYDSIVCKYV